MEMEIYLQLDSFIAGYDKAECGGSYFPKMASTTAPISHAFQQYDLPAPHREGQSVSPHPGIWVGPLVPFINRRLSLS